MPVEQGGLLVDKKLLLTFTTIRATTVTLVRKFVDPRATLEHA